MIRNKIYKEKIFELREIEKNIENIVIDTKRLITINWDKLVQMAELLIQRDEYRFKEISEVKPEIFEIYLKIVIDIYEGFVTLKPHPKAQGTL